MTVFNVNSSSVSKHSRCGRCEAYLQCLHLLTNLKLCYRRLGLFLCWFVCIQNNLTSESPAESGCLPLSTNAAERLTPDPGLRICSGILENGRRLVPRASA